MSKRKLIISEIEFKDGVKFTAHVRYYSFFGLIKSNYAIIKREDGSFYSEDTVCTFGSLAPTLFDSENEAFKEGRKCLEYWDKLKEKSEFPKIINQRSYSY